MGPTGVINIMFYQDIIDLDRNPFEEFSKLANFENVTIGDN